MRPRSFGILKSDRPFADPLRSFRSGLLVQEDTDASATRLQDRLRKRRWLLSLLFLGLDFLIATGIWVAFWYIRKTSLEVDLRFAPFQTTHTFFLLAAGMGAAWTGLYWLFGLYRRPWRHSRLQDFIRLFQASVLGVLVIGFTTFTNDPLGNLTTLRNTMILYFALHFSAMALVRIGTLTVVKRLARLGKLQFHTLIIGCGQTAEEAYQQLSDPDSGSSYRILGFLAPEEAPENRFFGKLKRFGSLDRLAHVIRSRQVEEVVIALDINDHKGFVGILGICKRLNVPVNVVPDMYDILAGNVKLSNVFGAPLVEVSPHLLTPAGLVLKRGMDVLGASIALLLGAPLFALLAILIKRDSPGPVFFRQERIGQDGRPFRIIKFRSMYIDAEARGPALSTEKDPRITPMGRFLRRSHLDELPQFWNVLVGEMSLVGPRPEREVFIEQIVCAAPEFYHVLKVKPGVTGWAQVKHGYASNLEEMLSRLTYDLIYIENMSLVLDIKILFYTLQRVIAGDRRSH